MCLCMHGFVLWLESFPDSAGVLLCCSGVSVPRFVDAMYQWSATLTQSGANYPFVLPVKADKYDSGFKVRGGRGEVACTTCARLREVAQVRSRQKRQAQ